MRRAAPAFPSLPHALWHFVERQPARVAFRFLRDGESESGAFSYAALDSAAQSWAAVLDERKVGREPALLILDTDADFVAALLGCLYAGAIAVPLYPPGLGRPVERIRAIAHDCSARFALTTNALAPRLTVLRSQLGHLQWLTREHDAPRARTEIDPAQTAVLQYTSGSTAAPKGVVITHANLAHNQAHIGSAFDTSPATVVVGWLPLFHDMGLIGNVLHTLYCGGSAMLMPPAAMVQKPIRWLRTIQRYQGEISGGPNFAYDLCARKISAVEREGLDLSTWRVAFNGSEPVSRATLDRFAQAFAAHGFRPRAFFPCYGLAEATLFVSGGSWSPGHDESPLVSCGRVQDDVRIVDPATGRECGEGETGEIWITGAGVAAGYWNHPAETDTFAPATLPAGRASVLRTGDLGCIRDGELFVTGRLKDLIIIRGRNHHPEDIERAVQASHLALCGMASAAFSVSLDEERLIVAQEVDAGDRLRERDSEAIAAAMRAAVAAAHQLQVHTALLVRRGTLPRTSSGKVQRYACRERYLAGNLKSLLVSTVDGSIWNGPTPP